MVISKIDQLFEQAIQQHQAGKLETAAQIYNRLLSLGNRNPDALHNLGILYMQKDEPASGLPLLAEALQECPENGQFWLSYIKALYKTGNPHQALRLLEQAKSIGLSGEKVEELDTTITATCRKEPDIAMLRTLELNSEYRRLEQETLSLIGLFGHEPELDQMLGAAYLGLDQPDKALSIFEKLCQAYSGNEGFWNHRAVALKKLGRLEQAGESYMKALGCAPENSVILSNLGGNLNDMKRFEDALPYLERSIALSPKAIGNRVNLANSLFGLGKIKEARKLIESVLQDIPDSKEALLIYGKILIKSNELDKAISILRKVRVKKSNNNEETLLALANALTKDGQTIEARQIYKQACRDFPQSPYPLVGLAALSLDEGEFQNVEQLCSQALKIEPDLSGALSKLVYIRKMNKKDNDWLVNATSLLQKPGLLPNEQMEIRYAIGKYFDDTKQYHRAFHQFSKANKLKKTFCKPYVASDHSELVDHLISVYKQELLEKYLNGASFSQRPVLVVGMPRSGTTLTEQIIASHPEACGAGELNFWRNQSAAYREETLSAKYAPVLLQKITYDCIENLEKRCPGASKVVDKMPGNFLRLGVFHCAFPKAKIIHTVRNPLDTCLSIFFQNFDTAHHYANDLEDLCYYYQSYHRLMAHWKEVIPQDILLELPYEALIEDQEKWSKKIIDFLDLEWNDVCLEFYKNKRRVGTASNWQARQPIYKTSKERWKNYEQFVNPLFPLLDLGIA